MSATPNRFRGLTVIELMIGMAAFGCLAVGGVWFVVRHTTTFDLENAARAWAQQLEYHYVSSTCTNAPADGSYVRCTVRVLEVKEPIALECGMVSQRCSMMKVSR